MYTRISQIILLLFFIILVPACKTTETSNGHPITLECMGQKMKSFSTLKNDRAIPEITCTEYIEKYGEDVMRNSCYPLTLQIEPSKGIAELYNHSRTILIDRMDLAENNSTYSMKSSDPNNLRQTRFEINRQTLEFLHFDRWRFPIADVDTISETWGLCQVGKKNKNRI